MSLVGDISGTSSTSSVVVPSWDPAICETILTWIKSPPSAALGWDSAAWEEARWAMAVHGVAPILYQKLHGSAAWTYLAPEMRQWLEEQYRFNGERVRRLMQELEHVLQAAEEAGIMVVPLKGSASLYTVYADDPALRPMADVDVLIGPKDEEAFTKILYRLGYVLEEHTPRHRSFAVASAQKVVYIRGEHPDNPRGIQVHTEVSEHFWGSHYDVTAALWEGERARFGAGQGWLSSPVGRMQHLLVHGSADIVAGKVRLARFIDVARLAGEFDTAMWQQLVDEGLRKKEARWLYTSLAMIERYLDAPIPSGVLEALGAETPAALREFLAGTTMYYLSFCNPLRVSLNERLTWHRLGAERAMALVHCLFPTPDQLRDYYPEIAPARRIPQLYVHHWGLMADGVRRLLFRVPRRSWLQRARGGR